MDSLPLLKEHYQLEDLTNISEKIVIAAGQNRIWNIVGEMGAGKTTLITRICKILGVKDSVSSPTFSLVNEYLTGSNKTIYHFDFYRIKTISEAYDMGYEEYFYSGNYCFIEWGIRVSELLPSERIDLTIKVLDEKSRIITLEKPKIS